MVEFVLFFSQGISHWTAKRCEGLSLNIFGDNRRNDVSSTSLQAGYFPLYGVCWWVLPIFPAHRQKAYLVIPPSSIKKNKPSDNPGWRKGCEGTVSCSRPQHNSSAPALITKVQRL